VVVFLKDDDRPRELFVLPGNLVADIDAVSGQVCETQLPRRTSRIARARTPLASTLKPPVGVACVDCGEVSRWRLGAREVTTIVHRRRGLSKRITGRGSVRRRSIAVAYPGARVATPLSNREADPPRPAARFCPRRLRPLLSRQTFPKFRGRSSFLVWSEPFSVKYPNEWSEKRTEQSKSRNRYVRICCLLDRDREQRRCNQSEQKAGEPRHG
jgi:hypothetical protein